MRFLSVFLLLVVFSSSLVIGIGISIPSNKFYFFEPGKVIEQKYSLLGSPNGAPMRINLAGDLKEFTTLVGRTEFRIGPNEPKSFIVRIELPDSLPMGYHKLIITAKEDALKAGGGASASAAVETDLTVLVPYEGKVPKTEFSASSVKVGEAVNFLIEIQNLGDVGIGSASADISIFDEEELLEIVKTSSSSVGSEQTRVLKAVWIPPLDIAPGTYSAKAKLVMDEIQHNLSTVVKIGSQDISFVDYPVELEAGKINEILVSVKSIWNQRISDVEITLKIFPLTGSMERTIKEVKSPVFEIDAWTTKEFPLYLNVPHSWTGKFRAQLILSFAGKEKVEDFKLSILGKSKPLTERETNINQGFFRIAMLLFLLVLIVINLGVYRYLKNKQENSIEQTF